jgi:hypothetical protein
MVHIAQELVHIDKGTPFFSNGSIMSQPANAGFLPTLMASTDAKHCKCPQFVTVPELTLLQMIVILNKYLWNVPPLFDHCQWGAEQQHNCCAHRTGKQTILASLLCNHPQILAGAQCSGTGWKAANNLRVPDASDAHVAGIDQAGRNCDRQSYPPSFYLAGSMHSFFAAQCLSGILQ